MRVPDDTPQLFRDAVIDFLNALDVSMERIAPFAGLHPEQLHRLGKDGKHHTLTPIAIERLLMAPVLVGKPVAPEVKDAWEKHLKVSSLYTVLIATARRRTDSKWPQTPENYEVVWKTATDLALYSEYTWYYMKGDSYQSRETRGFHDDVLHIHDRWSKNQLESEEDMRVVLDEIDKTA